MSLFCFQPAGFCGSVARWEKVPEADDFTYSAGFNKFFAHMTGSKNGVEHNRQIKSFLWAR